jgi:hypothetical protein
MKWSVRCLFPSITDESSQVYTCLICKNVAFREEMHLQAKIVEPLRASISPAPQQHSHKKKKFSFLDTLDNSISERRKSAPSRMNASSTNGFGSNIDFIPVPSSTPAPHKPRISPPDDSVQSSQPHKRPLNLLELEEMNKKKKRRNSLGGGLAGTFRGDAKPPPQSALHIQHTAIPQGLGSLKSVLSMRK